MQEKLVINGPKLFVLKKKLFAVISGMCQEEKNCEMGNFVNDVIVRVQIEIIKILVKLCCDQTIPKVHKMT